MASRFHAAVAALAGLAVAAGTAHAQTLYGITITGNELITINTSTGAGTLVGPLSSNMNAFGIAFRGNKLYAFDDVADRLRELNPATGATVNTIDVGITISAEGDIVFRSDGLGLLSAQGPPSLYRFDVTAPNSVLVGPLNPPMDGLAFNAAGVLYGLRDNGSALYTVDPATASTTLIGNTGISVPTVNSSGGLAFDINGTLFAVVSPWPPGPSILYRLDTSSGAATMVGNVGFNGVSGLAFQPTASPPSGTPTGNEGSYVGSTGPKGMEGAFGMGGRRPILPSPTHGATGPALLGPFVHARQAQLNQEGASMTVVHATQRYCRAGTAGRGTEVSLPSSEGTIALAVSGLAAAWLMLLSWQNKAGG